MSKYLGRSGPQEPTTQLDRDRCHGSAVAFASRLIDDGKGDGGHYAGRSKWGACFKCKRSLGCSRCTTPMAREVCCRPCHVWGTQEALHAHGPFGIEAYPPEWLRGYQPDDEQIGMPELMQRVHALAGSKVMP